MITDPSHLDRILTGIVHNAARLAQAWMDEDQAACAPSGQTEGRSATGPSDPTLTIAIRDRKWEHRDRVAATLLRVAKTLDQAVDARQPRTPSDPCACCRDELATHGAYCFACWRYRREMERPCDAKIHQGRPKVRLCDCDDVSGGRCCDPGTCTDRVGAGRARLSDRCVQRKARGLWDREDAQAS